MARLTERKIVLVYRETRLDGLIARYNNPMQARFHIEHLGADFSDYEDEDRNYRQSLAIAEECCGRLGIVQKLHRRFLPGYVFGPDDVVVAVGQDGLVANTLKYLIGQTLVGVNPDRGRWDGVLCVFAPEDLTDVVSGIFAGRNRVREVSMAQAILSDGQSLLAVNDFFIGQKSHTSARYRIETGGKTEDQSSSGILVSTGLGSTAWMTSVMTAAIGIAEMVQQRPENSGKSGNKKAKPDFSFPWEADRLRFHVREPFPTRTTGTDILAGTVDAENPLTVLSQMSENGVIFSDGVESDFLNFPSGVTARIGLAGHKGRLAV
jgi:hypothetical protein